MSQRSSAGSTAVVLVAMLIGYGTAAAQSGGAQGKIPITTSSVAARAEYLKGRALAENLRAHDSREFLERAAAKDPKLAMAHYSLAQSAPTAKDFFEHLKEAVALADQASEGERLMILGLQAGANADPKAQKDYYERLVSAYPRDERAHFLLGNAYFGQQDMPKAIREYRTAVEVAPGFAPAYNLLGYAERQVGEFGEAERAFKKYIELIPADPNPYDSYAELLMKMGRFDQSIAMYQKALSVDSNFAPSHIGIANNLMLQGRHDAARAEIWKLYQAARNDGDRRNALFTAAVTYADEGKFTEAVAELKKEFAVAEKINDAAAMSADAVAMGDVLLQAGKPDEARKRYIQAVELADRSDLSPEVKANTRLVHHFNLGRVAVRTNDLAGAKEHAAAYLAGATARKNTAQVRQAHGLAGSIAIAEKNFDRALAELAQGNQQDPYTVYQTALAYQGKGDQTKAAEMFQKVANQNTLPALNYAFVREKAKRAKA